MIHKTSNIKITIITVTYNSGKTIADTFSSVLAQNYIDYEYIVIDGGSTDNTVELIKMFEPQFKGRMRWISEQDKGIYDAMNKGISIAAGDVIGILNSDDFFTSNDCLPTIAQQFSNDDAPDAIYGDIHYVKSGNLNRCVRYYSSHIFRPWMMRFGMMPAHPSFYCKRTVYLNYGTFSLDYKIGADFDNLLRLIYIHKIRTVYIHKDFVTMRIGGVSTNGLTACKHIMHDHIKALKANGIYSNRFILSLRYIYKIYELLISNIKYNIIK